MAFLPAAAVICLAPAGCSFRGDIVRNALDYNRAMEDIANQELLLNVLRSKDRFPRVYTRLTQVTGALSLQTSATVAPSQVTASPPALGNTVTTTIGGNAGLTVRDAPTFVLSNLDSQAFRRGISQAVDPDVVLNYWRQGFPKAVLLQLFVRRVDVIKPSRDNCFFEAFPGNKTTYADFAKAVRWFVKDNPELTKENRSPQNFGPPVPVTTAGPGAITGLVAAHEAKLRVSAENSRAVQLQTPRSPTFQIRYPGDPNDRNAEAKEVGTFGLAKPGEQEPETENGRKSTEAKTDGPPSRPCSTEEGDSDIAVPAPDSKFSLRVYMRSADSLVYHLGELARAQLKEPGAWTPEVCETCRRDDEWEPFFKVLRGGDGAVAVRYRGETFRLPHPDDPDVGRTYQTMTLVQEVFSLSISAEDLPGTDVIRIAN